MPRIVLTLSTIVLALVLLPVPAAVRFVVVGWVMWAVPGWGYRRILLGSSHSVLLSVAVAAVLPWAVHGVLGTFGGVLGLPPMVLTVLVGAIGIACLWVPLPGPEPVEHSPRPIDDDFERGALIVAGLVLVVAAVAPPQRSLLSDVYAHVAAVRACIEENRIFPLHEFYTPSQGTGADPRFGVGHAYNASWAVLARLTALDTWHGMGAVAMALFTLATAALSSRASLTTFGRWVAFATFVGFFGGSFYNPFHTSPYPLWIGLAAVWVAMALVFNVARGRRAWLVALLIAGAGGMHALAFLFGVFFLVMAWLVAAPSGRRDVWGALWPTLAVGVPVMGVRFASSYGNVNPIHQWPWEIMEWNPGWFSVSPGFLLNWVMPYGLLALILVPWLVRRCRREQPLAWSLAVSIISIVWLVVPLLLTPSMKVLGFLPIRLVMTILTPLLLAGWIDELRAGRTRTLIVGVLLIAMLGGTVGRARELWVDDANSIVDTVQWRGLVEHLNTKAHADAVVLSDPFTMLALKSMAPQSIVAVPDGRSSPRDAQSIERLRDSWRAMNVTQNGAGTDEIFSRYEVTHVLVNAMFGQDRYSYEYPVDTASFAAQRQKFELNPQRFHKEWEADGLVLYELTDPSEPWNESYMASCVVPGEASSRSLPLAYGFRLDDPIVDQLPSAEGFLRIRADLGYDGPLPVPDRYLVVRLDAIEGPVPDALQFMNKPVRKILEKFQSRVYRHRWTLRLRGGACPSWTLDSGHELPLDLELPRPSRLHPGRYRLTLQTTRNTEFTVLKLKDFLRDQDAYTGPALAEIEITGP